MSLPPAYPMPPRHKGKLAINLLRERDQLTGEAVDLLQHLIRNECVNDGTAASGHESRSATVLQTVLEDGGLSTERFEPTLGRASVVARVEGRDRAAPSLCLMGHTDVVPVSPAGWTRDPFGGEVVDGEVWGRGSLDMLYLTATMAVASRSGSIRCCWTWCAPVSAKRSTIRRPEARSGAALSSLLPV